MAKTRFSTWRVSAILNFKNFIFGHVTVVEFQVYCCVSNFQDGGHCGAILLPVSASENIICRHCADCAK